MMRPGATIRAAVALGFLLSLCGCNDVYVPPPQPRSSGPTGCWQRGQAIYRDRNGDQTIDWQVSGENWRFDGVDVYLDDTNYDGFYDLKYQRGGITGGMFGKTNIHEPVPVVGARFIPIQKPSWVE